MRMKKGERKKRQDTDTCNEYVTQYAIPGEKHDEYHGGCELRISLDRFLSLVYSSGRVSEANERNRSRD